MADSKLLGELHRLEREYVTAHPIWQERLRNKTACYYAALLREEARRKLLPRWHSRTGWEG